MKATLKIKDKENMTIFFDNTSKDVHWDGIGFEIGEEWREWINEQLEWIHGAENYKEIRQILLVKTLWLTKNVG